MYSWYLFICLRHISYLYCHKSQITNHKSQITNHKLQITNHKSQITNLWLWVKGNGIVEQNLENKNQEGTMSTTAATAKLNDLFRPTRAKVGLVIRSLDDVIEKRAKRARSLQQEISTKPCEEFKTVKSILLTKYCCHHTEISTKDIVTLPHDIGH